MWSPDSSPQRELCTLLSRTKLTAFQGAKRLKEIREIVTGCLGSLTSTVEYTKGFMKLYTGDRELWDLAEDLYISLLDSTEAMLIWLERKSISMYCPEAVERIIDLDNRPWPRLDFQAR